ncbi:MAG: CPBP family intramembrane metalloprotease [Labilithrix sp.]|nr:CPBP family intramembrane metalloprotease [Labilithrix sp.]
MAEAPPLTTDRLRDRPGAWVDLGLTLPIFLVYHLAVVFLGVQNATDMVTGTLMTLSAGDKTKYLLGTLCIGVIFAGTFALLGRGQAFRPRKFLQIVIEGTVYAFVMAVVANVVVGSLFASVATTSGSLASVATTSGSLASVATSGSLATDGVRAASSLASDGQAGLAAAAGSLASESRFVGFIMSLGAGFYEELTFRVLLFGVGAKVLVWMFGKQRVELSGTSAAASGFSFRSLLVMGGWAIACAIIFSGVHYVGPMSDEFKLTSFTFRAVLGLILTLIYVTRGFAAAVWTHAIYDVWVLVLR